MSRYTKKHHGKKHKTRKNKTTRKYRGGGLIQSGTMLYYRNFINVLEDRLVKHCDDYDWVQDQRVKYYFSKKII